MGIGSWEFRSRPATGFTLLEILISLVILLIGLTAIMPLFALSARSHRHAIDAMTASRIADQTFQEVQETLTTSTPRNVVDRPVAEYPGYRVDVTYRPGATVEGALVSFNVRVRVKWKTPAGEEGALFESIVLRRIPKA